MKELIFETNAQPTLEFVSGEYVLVYFALKYKDSTEYFAHSLTQPAKVKMWKQDGTVQNFNGQLLCYFPGIFLIVISPEVSATLKTSTEMDLPIEIEVFDVQEQKHVAQRVKSLKIKPKLMA